MGERFYEKSFGYQDYSAVPLDDTYCFLNYPTPPEEWKPELRRIFLNNFHDFSNYAIYLSLIEKFLDPNQYVVTGPLSALNITKSMTNLKFDLGFRIDRARLALTLLRCQNCYVKYDNTCNYAVKVLFFPAKGKRGVSKYHHTFLVQGSGKITQSSHDENTLDEASKAFIDIIYEIRNYVEIKA
jgi:hypothetical protein